MRFWLILQPAWLRFVVWAMFLAVAWGLLITLESREEIESNVLSAIFFGAATAGLLTATSQATHRESLEALSGLDEAKRAEALDAVSRGILPADREARAAAIRLGRVSLRNKSSSQLKRAEILTWLIFGMFSALSVVAAVVNFNGDRVFYIVLAVLGAIVSPLSSRNSRRVQRNIALLAENPIPE
jgi:hypothetical protein